MLVPIFTLKLNQKIFPRLVTVGSYDGKHPCLTGATNGGKVFLHTPYHRGTSFGGAGGMRQHVNVSTSSSDSDITLLSFGQHITALAAGKLDQSLDTAADMLFIGSQTNLLAYDVENNSELFYKDLPDGANTILIGQLSADEERLALVGGNCAIQGLDHEGHDKYWTVTGDNVCSMALVDFNQDGHNELLVGSEDYEIRVFKHDELLAEIPESDVVISLCSVGQEKFAYSLINGEVGVYGAGGKRLWRTKSKSQPMCLHTFDMNSDGVPELVTGWSNGKIDIRSLQTGNIIFKDVFSSHIAGIVQADYRMDGQEELICCSVDGEVRGYLPPPAGGPNRQESEEGGQVELEELHKRKKELLLALKNYEVNELVAGGGHVEVPVGSIPAGTLIKTHYSATMPSTPEGQEKSMAHVELTVETNNGTVLRAVVVFAECLFEGESHVVHPPLNKLTSSITLPLFPEKDTPIELSIKAYVGHPSSAQFHVFEASRPLPRFSLYLPCAPDAQPAPQGSVTFNLNERIDRVMSWVRDNFLYTPEDNKPKVLQVAYMSLRTSTPLIMKVDPTDNGKTVIQTDDMDLAGDLVQSLVGFFSIEDLNTVADFPNQMEDLRNVLAQVGELEKVRQQLTAEMADNSGVIGNLVVRAEDARMMNHIGNMKKAYAQLYNLNKDLMTGYKIRSNNHMQLLECLKIVNQAIQKAGRLRAGKQKSSVVAACRVALKSGDVETLIKVIKNGPS